MKDSVKLIVFGVVGLIMCMHSGTAVAGDDFKRFALGASIGYYNTASSDIADVDANFDTTPCAGITGTFFINKSFSLELSTQFIQTELEAEYDGKTGKLGDIQQTPVFLTARYQHPIRKTNVNVYIGLGANYFINSFDQEKQQGVAGFFPLNIDYDINSSFGVHANVGAEMFFKKGFSVYVDLKAVFNQAEFDLVYPDLTEDTTDVAMNASVLGIGVNYYF